MELSRREVIAAGAAAGAALAFERAAPARAPRAGAARSSRAIDFARARRPATAGAGLAHRRAWRTCAAPAARACSRPAPTSSRTTRGRCVRRRPALPRRARSRATITAAGSAPGVVLRRPSPRAYYAAIYDAGAARCASCAASGAELDELAQRARSPRAEPPLAAHARGDGRAPDRSCVRARRRARRRARPRRRATRRRGAAARRRPRRARHRARRSSRATRTRCCPRSATCTCCPGASRRARRSWHTALGQAVVDEIRRRSTAGVQRDRGALAGTAAAPPAPSVRRRDDRRARRAAARGCTSRPTCRRASTIELSYSPRFRASRAGSPPAAPDAFHARRRRPCAGSSPGRRVYWRARLRRRGRQHGRARRAASACRPRPATAAARDRRRRLRRAVRPDLRPPGRARSPTSSSGRAT